MAAYAITVYQIEDYDYKVVTAGMETQLETLDSTTNPTIMATVVVHPQSGKFVGMILSD